MAMFSEELFNVFEEDADKDKKPKRKLKRQNIIETSKKPEEGATVTKKPKIDFTAFDGDDDDEKNEEDEKDGEDKMEEEVKEDDMYVPFLSLSFPPFSSIALYPPFSPSE